MVIPIIVGGIFAVAPAAPAIGTGIIVQGATTRRVAGEFRRRPGDVLQQSLEIQALSEAGLEPVVSRDPFTGDVVLSTADQSRFLFDILEEREIQRQLEPSAAAISRTRDLRDIVIQEGRAKGTSRLRLQQLVSSVPTSTRVTARLVGPGAVGRGNVPSRQAESRRIRERAGPCAGPQTGLSRLRCAQGAFT